MEELAGDEELVRRWVQAGLVLHGGCLQEGIAYWKPCHPLFTHVSVTTGSSMHMWWLGSACGCG